MAVDTEARITLGVVAARAGDLERALDHGHRALAADRVSVPSLLMVSSELGAIVKERYGADADAADYLQRLRLLHRPA